GNENDSPRGRILLMRSVVEGKLDLDNTRFGEHIDLCLGCRACETACPAGVEYGHLLEMTRAAMVRTGVKKPDTLPQKMLSRALKELFPFPKKFARVMTLNRFFRDSGLLQFTLWFKPLRDLMNKISPQAEFALSLLLSTKPVLGAKLSRRKQRKLLESVAVEDKPLNEKREVSVFTGCVMEGLFKHANDATSRVLVANGAFLVPVKTQVCCGALHAHAGEIEIAKDLARKNIEAFENNYKSLVIINSAGCGAMLKEYGELLKDDEKYAALAHEFSRRVRDVSEYLHKVGVREGAPIEESVTYDAPCHLYHAQRITSAPQEVLKAAIPNLDFKPLEGMQDCCGGAGIYNLSEPEMSDKILTDKVSKVKATGAQLLMTANPGCHMQLGAGCRTKGADCKVVHVVEVLDESYRKAGYYDQSPV
ncbi:MAG: hypothetical protein JST84_18685, partial [Acidobacteria bacterium]|nr:hypothetical protein [Acidobacteriota bacterium]